MAAKQQSETVEKEEFHAKPLPYLFEKELIQKHARYFWIVEDFRPNAVGKNVSPIERKFYARHDQQLPQQYQERFDRYTKLASRHTKECGLPRLESQVYGWLPQHIKHDDKLMKELNFVAKSLMASHAMLTKRTTLAANQKVPQVKAEKDHQLNNTLVAASFI